MAYLLLVPSQEAEEEKRFGLVGVWVHLNQFFHSSLEEVAKKLTLLISTEEDWYYTLVQVNEDAQHLPLSNARHSSVLADGAPSRSTCGYFSQLEVCQLLHLGSLVIYPGDLNGGLEPVWATLPKLPLWEMGSTSKDTQLCITLPRTTQGDSPEAVPLSSLTLVSSPHSITVCPSEVVTGPSLTEEIGYLLLNPMFEMPGEPSTHNSPHAMAKKEGNPPNPGETLQGYLKQPPPSLIGLHRWIQLTSWLLPAAPLTQSSGEGHQPNSSCVTGQLHQPIGGCIAPSGGDE